MLEPSKDIFSKCCAKTDINIPTNNSGSNDFKNRNKSIWAFYSILSSNSLKSFKGFICNTCNLFLVILVILCCLYIAGLLQQISQGSPKLLPSLSVGLGIKAQRIITCLLPSWDVWSLDNVQTIC